MYNGHRKRKGKEGRIVKDRFFNFVLASAMIGGAVLVGWGALIVLDRLFAAMGI